LARRYFRRLELGVRGSFSRVWSFSGSLSPAAPLYLPPLSRAKPRRRNASRSGLACAAIVSSHRSPDESNPVAGFYAMKTAQKLPRTERFSASETSHHHPSLPDTISRPLERVHRIMRPHRSAAVHRPPSALHSSRRTQPQLAAASPWTFARWRKSLRHFIRLTGERVAVPSLICAKGCGYGAPAADFLGRRLHGVEAG
jgi:hypothetical protein